MKDTVAYLQADVSPDVAKALTVKARPNPSLVHWSRAPATRPSGGHVSHAAK